MNKPIWMPVGTTSRQGSNLGVKVINMILAPLNRYTCYGAIEVVAIIIIIIIKVITQDRR